MGLPLARRRAPRRRPRRPVEPVPWDGESRGRAAGGRARGSPGSTTTTTARRVVHRRRLAHDRRRRHRRPRGLHPPRRPHQGRGEVRRRVDQLGRARERDHGPPQGGRGRRHRRGAPQVAASARWPAWWSSEGEDAHQGGASSSSSTAAVAKWWLPDDVVFIDEVPKTSVGKFSKKDLRDRFADYTIPGRRRPDLCHGSSGYGPAGLVGFPGRTVAWRFFRVWEPLGWSVSRKNGVAVLPGEGSLGWSVSPEERWRGGSSG